MNKRSGSFMIKYSYPSIVLALSILISACASIEPLTTEHTVDKIMSDFNSPNAPGAAVLVMKSDSVVFQKAYGVASVKNTIPVTASTNFRLASITKQFTAMSILLLLEQEKLSLNDKLVTFFPEFPDTVKRSQFVNY